MAQDWITARAFIVPVTPAINHAWSTRVSVPKSRTELTNIEVVGSLPVISATADEAQEEYRVSLRFLQK